MRPEGGDPVVAPAPQPDVIPPTTTPVLDPAAARAEGSGPSSGPVAPMTGPSDQRQPPVEVEGADPGSGAPVSAHIADPARRRALLPWLIAAGTLIVLGSIAFGLTFTPLFRADEIRIRGESHLSEAKVLRIAGLGPSTNLIHADLAGAERRLERQPWIARATVSRSLPHGLDIQVVERVPVVVTLSAGRRVLASAQGVVLGSAPKGSGLPAVVSPEGGGDLTTADLRSGGEVAAAMPSDLRAQIDSITVDGDGSIMVRTDGGVLVTYGEGSQLEAKAQSLKAVLAWGLREGKDLATVDVTVPGSPTGRLSGGAVVVR